MRGKLEPCSPKNVFELFGADYMFDVDMRPWLLEVNAGPVIRATEMPMVRGMMQKVLVKGRGRHRHEEGDWLEVPLNRGDSPLAAPVTTASSLGASSGKASPSVPSRTGGAVTGTAGDAK